MNTKDYLIIGLLFTIIGNQNTGNIALLAYITAGLSFIFLGITIIIGKKEK
jgi:hypothetical protein